MKQPAKTEAAPQHEVASVHGEPGPWFIGGLSSVFSTVYFLLY